MKLLSLLVILVSLVCSSQAQQLPDGSYDTPPILNNPYVKYIYDPTTLSTNFSYDYSNQWDLDGDGNNDSLYFIGNDGAHTYFYLRIILSTDHKVRDFTTPQIDFPLPGNKEALDKCGESPALQFVVHDFNKDGTSDIYLNFDNPYESIPKSWKQKGITKKCVVMSFAKGKLKISNYKP